MPPNARFRVAIRLLYIRARSLRADGFCLRTAWARHYQVIANAYAACTYAETEVYKLVRKLNVPHARLKHTRLLARSLVGASGVMARAL